MGVTSEFGSASGSVQRRPSCENCDDWLCPVEDAGESECADCRIQEWLNKRKAGSTRKVLLVKKEFHEAKVRAARRCSDCAHWWTGSERMGCTKVLWPGETREYEGVWADTADAVRHLFRTAASCPDYEEVREREEGVEG